MKWFLNNVLELYPIKVIGIINIYAEPIKDNRSWPRGKRALFRRCASAA